MVNGGRIWLVVGGLLGAVIILLGWLVVATPLFGQAELADAQRAQVEALNATQEANLAEMKALDAKKDELLQELDGLQESVPVAVDTADYVDWLTQAANESAVSLVSVKVDDATVYDASKGTGSVQFSPELANSLYLVPIKLELGGTADQIGPFLAKLQSEGRLQLLNVVHMQLGTQLTTEVNGYIFVVHDPSSGPLPSLTAPKDTGGKVDGSTQAPTDDSSTSDTPTPSDAPTPSASGRR